MSSPNTISTDKFKLLLERAKALAAEKKREDEHAAISTIEQMVDQHKPSHVDLSLAGVRSDQLQSKDGFEAAVEVVSEISTSTHAHESAGVQFTKRDAGVARDVTLNAKQAEFIESALSGEDLCLIGAAGTGKTTVVGKFIRRLMEEGTLRKIGYDTKWLRSETPGVLICSFTRKAVNNIRRALPDELKPHALTLHKVLEFAPVYYEIPDPKNPMVTKKTMRFEPQRTATNPLPSTLTHVIYEESSMIGTDLYNMFQAAVPHQPQEIFIGDIRQLPPVFGSAILGFKLAVLKVVELDEVYRQALLSPIIRLAHSILSGDSNKFSARVETRTHTHPHLGTQIPNWKFVPALEKYNESGEHGTVKFQIWQKKLPSETACNTAIQQFIAWTKTSYYKPMDDLILCPFNVSFGCDELNRGIHQFLGNERGAVVHEIISGIQKHYLAVGDRILYDKEDAVIVDIRRNISYLGKAPQPASVNLDRWGALRVDLTEEELQRSEEEQLAATEAAIDAFMDMSGEDEEGKVTQAASHAIDIQFAYSEETITLSMAGDINSILGGHAITVHKAQGSEADSVFLVLHHSHAAMINNELLYTAVTRARNKLHILCEIDTFFKGVKTQKVRGVTLADKIETFKGKTNYADMEAEMQLLRAQKAKKLQRLQQERAKHVNANSGECTDAVKHPVVDDSVRAEVLPSDMKQAEEKEKENGWSNDSGNLMDSVADSLSTDTGSNLPIPSAAIQKMEVLPEEKKDPKLALLEKLRAMKPLR